MAHELTKLADGSYSMLRAEDSPVSWHGLETLIPVDSPFDTWANHLVFDWKIQRGVVRFNTDRDGAQSTFAEQHVLFRSDNHAPLSIVGADYNVVQPKEVLEFFRDVCEKNQLKMDTAGIIRGGKKFWALARTGNEFKVAGTDAVKQYVLLASSADSSMATTAKHTSFRVVCSNTFHASISNGEAAVRIRHNRAFDPDDVKINLGLMDADFTEFGRYAEEMHRVPLEVPLAKHWLAELLNDTAMTTEEVAEFSENSRLFRGFWNGYVNGKGAEPTLWGAFNGVTYTVDNVRGRSFDTRFDSAQFGTGASLKAKAWEKARAIIDNVRLAVEEVK